MIQSCGLYMRAGNSDEQVEFINCEMTMPFVNDTNSQKVSVLNEFVHFFAKPIVKFQCWTKSEDSKILDCYNGGLGYLLQIEAERITHQIAKPYPALVPTVVYNSVSNVYVVLRNQNMLTYSSLEIRSVIYFIVCFRCLIKRYKIGHQVNFLLLFAN